VVSGEMEIAFTPFTVRGIALLHDFTLSANPKIKHWRSTSRTFLDAQPVEASVAFWDKY